MVCIITDSALGLFDKNMGEIYRGKRAIMDRRLKHDKLERAIRSISGDCLFIFEVDLRENRFLSLVENTDEMGFIIPEEGVYSGLSEQICGCVAEEYRSMRREFGSIGYLRKMLAQKDAIECEYQVGKGKNIWWRDSFRVMEYDEAEPVKVAWEHVGIDRQKKMQLAQQKAVLAAYKYEETAGQVRNEFFNILCHNLKNQMNAITGMTAIASSYLNDTECVRDSLDTIKQTIREMYLLFDRAEDILKMEPAKPMTDDCTFSLTDALRRMVDELLPEAKEHGHMLTMDMGGVIHDSVLGDKEHIRQIVMCLLHNAISYTNQGGTICIGVSEQDCEYEGYRMFEITIEDNGIGMSKSFQTIMFEPFTRERDFPFGNIEGTGLSLTLARNMACAMGGDVTIESQKGFGTRAKVLLKLLPEENIIKNVSCI